MKSSRNRHIYRNPILKESKALQAAQIGKGITRKRLGSAESTHSVDDSQQDKAE